MKEKILAGIAAALMCLTANADEGMWLVNAINEALMKNMQERGLQLQAGAVYDAGAPGASLCDAVVSLDFGCTGSVISDQGLVITNHHCAYADIYALSTDEHNYLEDGYWAFRSDQEIPIQGKSIYFLNKVIDVTTEAERVIEENGLAGKPMGMRRLSHLLEKKYSEESGLDASLYSMWNGERYYIALYKVYTDIRLVAAPPVSIAAFGGDIDNWEWPQHKCDFAMYRIYADRKGNPAAYSEKNVPLKTKAKLRISTEGYSEGDFAMVIGYPGRTNRYSSSAKVNYLDNAELPISTKLRSEQMSILTGWMNSDPSIRLKYSDKFFSLSNVQELQEGQLQCCKRFDVVAQKQEQEQALQAWIDADADRKAEWGGLLSDLKSTYSAMEAPGKQLEYYRETMVRASRLSVFATRINSFCNSADKRNPEGVRKACAKDYAEMDLKVEKDLVCHSIVTYYRNILPELTGPFQQEMLKVAGGDPRTAADNIWNTSWMSDEARMDEFLRKGSDITAFGDDPLIKFFTDVKYADFNDALDKMFGKHDVTALNHGYTHALYEMNEEKGIPVYPDANSSMRITYGRVCSIDPHDAVHCHWQSTTQGILEKYDPQDYNYTLKEEWRSLLLGGDAVPVDFLTDNDITGGNSGSPVMNARGELIGLAFDGNKESLAGDVYFTPEYNRCVNVDIRFVLWTLRNYAHLDRILKEIGQ